MSPPVKPPLYVHIGHGKAASTTLQQALRVNADTVRSHGLLISDRHLEFPSEGAISGHPLIMLDEMLWKLEPDEANHRFSACIERLKAALQKGGFRGAVLSSENLYNKPAPPIFRNIPQDFDLHVLYLVRRQDEWLESAWKQWGIKTGATLPDYVEEELKIGRPDYLASARRWKEIGAEMRVIPLHEVKDIPALVFDWLGITDSTPLPVPRLNETLDYSVLDMLSRNPFLFPSITDTRIFGLFEQLLPEYAPRVGYGRLTPEIREKILAHFKEENETLQREFFPTCQPLDQYPLRTKAESPAKIDPTDSMYRYLGINLLLIKTLNDRLNDAAKEIRKVRTYADSVKEEASSLKAELKRRRKDESALVAEIASTFPISFFLALRRGWRKLRRKMRGDG